MNVLEKANFNEMEERNYSNASAKIIIGDPHAAMQPSRRKHAAFSTECQYSTVQLIPDV